MEYLVRKYFILFGVEILSDKFILCIVPRAYSTCSSTITTLFLGSKSWNIKMVNYRPAIFFPFIKYKRNLPVDGLTDEKNTF